MDYVVNYGTTGQFRASVEVLEITHEKGPSTFSARVNRIGAKINPLAIAKCTTAAEAHRVAELMLRDKFGSVEHYQRDKHRELSLGKILK